MYTHEYAADIAVHALSVYVPKASSVRVLNRRDAIAKATILRTSAGYSDVDGTTDPICTIRYPMYNKCVAIGAAASGGQPESAL